MFAITATAINPDDPLRGLTLGEVDDPQPQEGWVTVDVKAASLNHHDIWTLRGVGIHDGRLPIVLGCDAAGFTPDGTAVVVHALIGPADVPDETMTEERSILSERYDGTFADKVVVPARNLIAKPDSLTFEEAACLPTAWLTAYRMLFVRGQLRPGQRVLIQGAGGGVATAATVLARAAGAHVSVTSRDAAKLAQAQEIGAHAVYESGARLAERVDVVIETVGDATWSHSLKSLVPGGVLVVSGATSGQNPPADLARVFFRQLSVIGSTMGTRNEFVDLVRLLDATGARPIIADTMDMEDGRRAFTTLLDGDVFGKLVLTR
ncbi:MAG: zinc-binding dehydrogenase [Nitriliruptoraceae bacterium]